MMKTPEIGKIFSKRTKQLLHLKLFVLILLEDLLKFEDSYPKGSPRIIRRIFGITKKYIPAENVEKKITPDDKQHQQFSTKS